MKHKNKLLFIAGYFPPAYYSSGSVRAWNMAKYLSKLGWQVTVITPSPETWNPNLLENVELVKSEISNLGIKMIYTNHLLRFMDPGRLKTSNSKSLIFLGGVLRKTLRIFNIPSWVGWLNPANLASSSIRADEVDVILATGAPFIGFELAYRISKRLDRPFVLDYRDLWTSNPVQKKMSKSARRREESMLKACRSVVVISPSIKVQLYADYNIQVPITVITNGYDAEEIGRVLPANCDHFSIVYAGGVIMPSRSLESFFLALSQIRNDVNVDSNWRFHYLGSDMDVIRAQAEKFQLEDKVVIHGKLPQRETWSILKGAGLSLIVTNVNENPSIAEKGVITGKIFETIGLGTPMLVIAPKGSDVEQVVLDSGNGVTIPAQQVGQMADFIKQVMAGNVPAVKEPQKYSWESLSLRLDTVLQEAMK